MNTRGKNPDRLCSTLKNGDKLGIKMKILDNKVNKHAVISEKT